MTAPIITLADAMTLAISAASLGDAFTVERVYIPKYDLEESGIGIKVVPNGDTRAEGTYGSDTADLVVDVGVKKRLADISAEVSQEQRDASEKMEVDLMLDFCERIKALFNRQRVGSAICYKTEQTPIYDPEKLEGSRTFLTVLKFTFAEDIDL